MIKKHRYASVANDGYTGEATAQKYASVANDGYTGEATAQEYASVAKWYGNGLLNRIPQVRILSDALSACSSVGRAFDF